MVIFDSITDPEVATHFLDSGVGIIPTDTIYGITARALDKTAVARLYAIKHREGKPGTVIAANIDQLLSLGLAEKQLQAVAHVWPNPVSIVLSAPKTLAYLDQGKRSIAVRVTKDKHLRALLEKTGPLLTSSANWPGEPPANSLEEAQDYFGEEVDFYVDGGVMRERLASTVGRLLPDGSIETLRQGVIVISQEHQQ